MFPICFGYLIFPLSAVAPQLMIQDQIINGICSNILRSLEKKIPELDNNSIDSNDLRDVLRSMVKETDPSKIMNIRYVPPDRMIHFMIPSLKFYPYGESIFDSSQFTAKCLIALETALAIHRLNRSIEKRSIGIETGLPRDSRKQIEMMKEEIRKRKISLDSFGTIDTIPSMITSFEDLYVPMKDGKRFVEITTFQDAGADTRGKVDELKFMRDSVVASLGVPPSYINIEEGLSNKCIALKTLIPLINGGTVSLEGLIKEYEKTGCITNKWAYSYDKETGKMVPGKISWAGVTRKNAIVVKVTLDNGESMTVTPDHNIMLRNGEYCHAEDLKLDDSLMPLYKEFEYGYSANTKLPYERIYHPGINEWQSTHRMVALYEGIISENDGLCVHHRDGCPNNNAPHNLIGLTNSEHQKLHEKQKKSGKDFKNPNIPIWSECEYCGIYFEHLINSRPKCCCKEHSSKLRVLKTVKMKMEKHEKRFCVVCNKELPLIKKMCQRKVCSNECLTILKRKNRVRDLNEMRKDGRIEVITLKCPYCGKEFTRQPNYMKSIKCGIITCGSKECYSKSFIEQANTPEGKEKTSRGGKNSIASRKNALAEWNKKDNFKTAVEASLKARGFLNHRVVSVEFLNEREDTGDITVEKYHNFGLKIGAVISNSALGEESNLFARCLIGHQKYLTHQIQELVLKIYQQINPEQALRVLDDVSVNLPAPRSLQLEREAAYTSNAINLVQQLQGVGIPIEYSKKKYINADWEEVKKYEIDDKIDKTLGLTPPEDQSGMGGMMGGGMMGGGMPGGGGMPPGGMGGAY